MSIRRQPRSATQSFGVSAIPSTVCASAITRALRVIALACPLLVLPACRGGDATAPGVTVGTPTATPAGAPAAPLAITRLLAPDTLRPGAVLAIEGTGFAAAAHAQTVQLRSADGAVIPTIVEIATPTRLDVRLPSAAAFPCVATGSAQLEVSTGAASITRGVTLAVARRVALAVGESAPLLDAAAAGCTELAADAAGATYALAVLNTTANATSASSLTVRANSVGGALPSVAPMVAAVSGGHASVAAEANDHDRHLADQSRIIASAGSAVFAWRAVHGAAINMAASRVVAPLAVGTQLSRTVLYGACNAPVRITTRVAYVGTRSVILEDVSSPHAGRMDAELSALGREYDERMHPALVEHLGDPLALDATMQGDGRITMVITGAVSQVAPGVTGFVSACNFYPRRTHAESNEDALFYARAPHAGESLATWRRIMRSTVMHEAKHIASFAERLARGAAFEEPWLEEATARIAEELYARSFANGGAWRGNGGWADVVRCEVYQCDDRPLMLWKHFPVLHDYLAGVESRTPLGAADANDVTFYASGWSLVRWAADHYGAHNEAAFLRALVRGTSGATGVTALARLTGRPAEELLADWSLAQWLDDRAGFVPQRATLSFPSWNLPDIMHGLAQLDPSRYRASPLPVRDVTGDRVVTVPTLRGYSASFLESTLAPRATQLLALRGGAGASAAGALPASIRLAVVRVR